jgi:peptidoglycan/LPS O-acetylase OafA/YrhL
VETKAGYRAEVDGLRAIAVMSVLLYHAGVPLLPTGFLGVDIFLVISGYLITQILFSELETKEFSIWRFYERRIRRIAPALLFVMTLSIPFAYWLMNPDDLKSFAQSVIATILFSNNILLWISSSYFDLDLSFKPLMHTWSLGVEEQYYIAVPLLMWALHRIGTRRVTFIGIAIITIASFAFCLWAVKAAPRANFYLITSRAWELGSGGLIALGERSLRARLTLSRWRTVPLATVGLIMIVAPMMLLPTDSLMPGLPTLIPVAGTCLILMFAQRGDPATWLLSTRPFVAIGLISYSAYLFHQPIFAFTRVHRLERPSLALMLALVAVTLVCAYASWRYIERPFRQKTMAIRPVLWINGLTASAVFAAGAVFYLTAGFYRSWPELAERDTGFSMRQNMIYNTGPDRYQGAVLPPNGTSPNVLVLGNSFGRDFINMGIEAGALSNSHISFNHMQACPPAPLARWITDNARRADFIVLAFDFAETEIPCVSVYVRTVRSLSNARIIVFGNKSFGWNDNAVMRLDPTVRYVYRAKPVAEIAQANAVAARLFPKDMYVDVLGMIIDRRGRVPEFTPDHYFISPDRLHFTRAGAAYIGSLAFSRHPALRDLAARNMAARRHDQRANGQTPRTGEGP